MSVSIATTALSACVLISLTVGAGMSGARANVIAVLCGILPSYLANRYWVWERRGRSSMAREVAPFWVLSLAGLVISTLSVARVDVLTRHWSDQTRAVALPIANLSVFGALWIVQFVLLDRVLFRSDRPDGLDVELGIAFTDERSARH